LFDLATPVDEVGKPNVEQSGNSHKDEKKRRQRRTVFIRQPFCDEKMTSDADVKHELVIEAQMVETRMMADGSYVHEQV